MEGESTEIIKVLGLTNNTEKYQKIYNQGWKNINQQFRLQKINGIKKYLIKEINQNDLMSKKYKKVCRVFNYIDHLLIVFFTITGCVSISAFAFLVGIPIVITSSAMGLKNCALTPGIKKHKLIIKR